jgi:hypothetical protein
LTDDSCGLVTGIGTIRLARVAGFITGAVARLARTSSSGVGIVPNVTGRARVA